jgi:hypothetical protein
VYGPTEADDVEGCRKPKNYQACTQERECKTIVARLPCACASMAAMASAMAVLSTVGSPARPHNKPSVTLTKSATNADPPPSLPPGEPTGTPLSTSGCGFETLYRTAGDA